MSVSDRGLALDLVVDRKQFASVTSDLKTSLDPSNWRAALAAACLEVADASRPVLVCLAGPPSAGKTTLGCEIRRKGLPGIAKRRVALIDDGVMSIDFFGFPLGRIRRKSKERDDLAPFTRWLRGKKVVVFVGIRPWQRVGRCDILLRVHCSGEERGRRQNARGKTSAGHTHEPPDGWIGSARVFELATG